MVGGWLIAFNTLDFCISTFSQFTKNLAMLDIAGLFAFVKTDAVYVMSFNNHHFFYKSVWGLCPVMYGKIQGLSYIV